MMPLRFMDRLRFFIERQFARGAFFQLLVVAVFVGLISLTGGLLVAPFEGPFESVGEAVWWAFLRLTDPGYLGDDEGTWQRFVSTLLTLSGYVVFLGALVAIMTSWLIRLMRDLERGLTPVSLKNHIAVLGWSSQTAPLIGELMRSSGRMRRFLEKHEARRLKLVILAEDVSPERLLELRNESGVGSRYREIILRSGLAIQSEALHRVACLQAAAVIIPSAVHEDRTLINSDTETAKILLSIASQARQSRQPLPFCVAELQDIRRLPVLERAYPGRLEVVAGDATIARLLAQNLLHPGLSGVCNELLSGSEGNEIHVRSGEAFEGQTLAEIASRLPAAIVMGMLKPGQDGGWEVSLPAPRHWTVTRSDRVVMMARQYADTEPGQEAARLPEVRLDELAAPAGKNTRPRQVLILGWNRKVPALLQELASYQSRHFVVEIASLIPAREREQHIRSYMTDPDRIRCSHIEADCTAETDLRKLNPEACDAIILLSSDRLDSGEEADARSMLSYLQLEDVLHQSPRRPQLILELSDPGNRHLLTDHFSEILISPVILSHILAQVALRRELRAVLDHLFMAGGGEIQFRDPADYPLPASVDFQWLETTLAAGGEVALGIDRAGPEGSGSHPELNPPRKTPLALRPGDRLIVLARG